MYTEQVAIDKIEILEDGQIQIRKATKVFKDGIEIAKTYHRHVIEPGQDTSEEDDKVKAVTEAIWTEEVINAYEIKKNSIIP